MTKNQIIFLVGALLVLVPLSGFPGIWKFYFYVLSGIFLMALTFLPVLRRKILSYASQPKNTVSDVYVENRRDTSTNSGV